MESIRFQYQLWLQKARDRGHAIAIGHPHSNTIQFLQQHLAQTQKHFRFSSVSKLLRHTALKRGNEPYEEQDSSLAQNEVSND